MTYDHWKATNPADEWGEPMGCDPLGEDEPELALTPADIIRNGIEAQHLSQRVSWMARSMRDCESPLEAKVWMEMARDHHICVEFWMNLANSLDK